MVVTFDELAALCALLGLAPPPYLSSDDGATAPGVRSLLARETIRVSGDVLTIDEDVRDLVGTACSPDRWVVLASAGAGFRRSGRMLRRSDSEWVVEEALAPGLVELVRTESTPLDGVIHAFGIDHLPSTAVPTGPPETEAMLDRDSDAPVSSADWSSPILNSVVVGGIEQDTRGVSWVRDGDRDQARVWLISDDTVSERPFRVTATQVDAEQLVAALASAFGD